MTEIRLTRPRSGYAAPQMADEGARTATPAEEYPPYVVTDKDRTRWENAGTVARDMLGSDATDEAVWGTQRVIYHDRVNYPD